MNYNELKGDKAELTAKYFRELTIDSINLEHRELISRVYSMINEASKKCKFSINYRTDFNEAKMLSNYFRSKGFTTNITSFSGKDQLIISWNQ